MLSAIYIALAVSTSTRVDLGRPSRREWKRIRGVEGIAGGSGEGPDEADRMVVCS